MILYQLDTLQLTQEKEKKLSVSVFYWVIRKIFRRVHVILICAQTNSCGGDRGVKPLLPAFLLNAAKAQRMRV